MNNGLRPNCKSFDYDPINDTSSNEQTWIAPLEAIPGKFYDSPKWGRVLCCGTTDPERWIPAFAVRTGGQTDLRFLGDQHGIALSLIQAWDNQPEEKPEPKSKVHFLHNTLVGGDGHGRKVCNPQFKPVLTTCLQAQAIHGCQRTKVRCLLSRIDRRRVRSNRAAIVGRIMIDDTEIAR